jgi:hypothetical protein
MIPIKEAIGTGAWLHCEINESTKFRLKVLSFRKLNLSEVDEPEKIHIKDENTILWIMDIEVINLSKEPISSGDEGPGKLILVDQDGFKFYAFQDSHLTVWSDFAEKSKMNRFYVLSKLSPKIKAVGAITFLLPDDDEAVYSISIRGGSVKEV